MYATASRVDRECLYANCWESSLVREVMRGSINFSSIFISTEVHAIGLNPLDSFLGIGVILADRQLSGIEQLAKYRLNRSVRGDDKTSAHSFRKLETMHRDQRLCFSL